MVGVGNLAIFMSRRKLIYLINHSLAFCVIFFISSCNKDKVPLSNYLEQITFEAIPGSTYHDQNATWWGYNQQKIVRFEDKVFMAVIEN